MFSSAILDNNLYFTGLLCKDTGPGVCYSPFSQELHLSAAIGSSLIASNKNHVWLTRARIKDLGSSQNQKESEKSILQNQSKGSSHWRHGEYSSWGVGVSNTGQLFSILSLLCSGVRLQGTWRLTDLYHKPLPRKCLNCFLASTDFSHDCMQHGHVVSQSKINECYQKWGRVWGMHRKRRGVHNHKFLPPNVLSLSASFSSEQATPFILCLLVPVTLQGPLRIMHLLDSHHTSKPC